MQFNSEQAQKKLWNAFRDVLNSSRQGPTLREINREGYLPLSFAQQRFWLVNQLNPNSSVYNEYAAFLRLKGSLNIAALEQSLNEIRRRHEVLRTNFSIVNGQPLQKISPYHPISLPVIDIQKIAPDLREAEVRSQVIAEAQQPFNLEQDPLLRFKLLRLDEAEYALMVTVHHIVYDGWSQGIFIQELSTLYNSFCDRQPSPLPELPIQYADFAHWQREWLQGKILQSQIDYWKQQLNGSLPVLNLPTISPRIREAACRQTSPIQTYQGARYHLALPKQLLDRLDALSQSENVTLFMTLLAAFKTLLYRYTGQKDILVGSPIANRNRREISGLIGCFVNTLVLRTDLSGNPNFRELLGRIRDVALEAYTHQDLPFEKLVEELHPNRDISKSPLFQVMFVLQNTAIPTWEIRNLTVSTIEVENQTAKFDLTLLLEYTPQGLMGLWEYNTKLFDVATIAKMAEHFQILLEGIVSDPDRPIYSLPMLTPAEQHQLIVEWNNTQIETPKIECIHQLFAAQVERTPDAVAVICADEEITYRELNEQADRLANYLQEIGVKPEFLVGICVERSLIMVVGILAILKAGGAYIPLDPAYPPERLNLILEDANISLLLTESKLLKILPKKPAKIICLDNWETTEKDRTKSRQNYQFSQPIASNLAYLIYTSGSTGRPKGVCIEHHSAVTLLQWAKTVFTPAEMAGVLAATSICFDLSVFELFVPLSWGGTVILAENALHLPSLKAADKVTLINTVPSAIAQLFKIGGIPTSVRTINLAGEALSNRLVQQLYQLPHIEKVFNLYGPSEDTTYSTFALIPKGYDAIPPIGRPLLNTQCFILDAHLQLVPIGVPGELYLGGDGLARGYLNRPVLTAEKFIQNQFSHNVSDRLYKTGDIVRYLSDSNLDYLGRIDHQVKIRGFRIELGEIEAFLSQHPAVEQVVVVDREDRNGDKHLVAYLVTHQPAPTPGNLRAFLAEQLPDYMVPSRFLLLDALPLTPTGKVDRRALPDPELAAFSELENGFVAPRDTWELQLVKIWESLLNTSSIGVKESFFELGGHSLLAVSLMAEIKKQFGQQLPLTTLFQKQTIEQLATVLRRQQQTQTAWVPLVEIQSGNGQKPFFCVHPVGGNVLCYLDLARDLGADRPFYGLQARGLDGQDRPYANIEEMAACYIEAIRTAQPRGPYCLGGWSMGGVVAFEMAIQLQRQGDEVALLALIDSWAPNSLTNSLSQLDETDLLLQFAKDLSLGLGDRSLELDSLLRSLPSSEQLNFILQQAQIAGVLPGEIEPVQFYPLLDVFKTNLQAIQRYVPQIYSQKITLFRASESLSDGLQDPASGWHPLSTEPLELYNLPGNHYTILTKPCVEKLSAQLRHSIDRASTFNLQE
ncbi:amino acid adenylation domain-containing protein [Kamptonema animale CS-326]|jgi:amino acid adenylation domain-containing protein|uniref:non-ribosomal peptide synthetase n=1 Tax=Kamptonema animale TaxID=92934 RepID=UPI00232C2CDA|nr:non-ribosomal peptide synthetase [Kamptonema animale]MDB9513158.1 amino acid adenylation domain-containing protein [Kamptonema animale CS-326]